MNTTEIIIVLSVVAVAVAVIVVTFLVVKAKNAKAAAPASTSRELQSPGLFVEGLFEGLDQAETELKRRNAAGFRDLALGFSAPPPTATTDPKP